MSNFHQHWFTTPPSNSKPNLAYKQARIIATQILFYLIKGRFGLHIITHYYIHICIMKISLRVSTESTKTLRSWDTEKTGKNQNFAQSYPWNGVQRERQFQECKYSSYFNSFPRSFREYLSEWEKTLSAQLNATVKSIVYLNRCIVEQFTVRTKFKLR